MARGVVVRGEGSGPFKASGRNTDGRFDLFAMDVGYASGPPLHTHAAQEDSFYVVDGVLTVQLGDDIIELAAGDFASAPPGVPHTFTNVQPDQAARIVNLMTPGIGFDEYIQQLVGDAPPEPAAMEKLNQDFGVQMVGPPLSQRLGLSQNSSPVGGA